MSTAELTRPAFGEPRFARLIVPVVLLGLIACQMAITRSDSLLNRRLWLDEFHTLLLVEDPSLPHAMEALQHGVDTNAPALYLIARAVSSCVGSSGPVTLRGIGVVSVVLGVIGIYAAVRRVYSPTVAMIATLTIWAHPLITHQAFEARFYGPWFASVVWLAYALNLWDRSRSKLGPACLIAMMSVLVCTIHYLGVISLALVVAAHSLFVRRPWRETLLRTLPVGFGFLALGACIPLYLGQRQAISVPTWMALPTIAAVRDFFDLVYRYYLFAIPMAGFFASRLLEKGRIGELVEERNEDVSELAGLASLAALPVAFVVFSFAIQSVLIDRYAIAAVASFGPLIAPIVARTRGPVRWAVLIGLLTVSTANLMAVTRWSRITEVRRREVIDEVAKLAEAPILCRSRADLYELWWDVPAARDRLYYWDPKDQDDQPSSFDLFEREMARNHEHWYGLPRATSLASLRNRPLVYLYGLDAKRVIQIERSDPGVRLKVVDQRRGIFEATWTTARVTKLE